MPESSNDEEELQSQEEKAKQLKELYEQIPHYLMETKAVRVKSTDVIYSGTLYNGFGRETMTMLDFRKLLVRQFSSKIMSYLRSHFEGQYLPSQGGGWQKGRLQITFEFLPEEEIEKEINRLDQKEKKSQEPEESTDEPKDTPPPEPPSVLDDIRRDMGLL